MFKKNIIINNNKISYILKNKTKKGNKATVVFLCGYKSDKNGKKALFIESIRKKMGFEYLRFDYSGHGESSGNIDSLLFSDWINESRILIEKMTKYPLILVGSSMGGWIAFYLSSIIKTKILGVVGISTAADFTLKLEKKLNKKEYEDYIKQRKLVIISEYSNTPYIFSKNFINNSKKFFLLKKKVRIKCKSTLLYGLKDNSVELDTQIELLKRFTHPNTSLVISKNSDHRMSSNYDLEILKNAILNYIKNS